MNELLKRVEEKIEESFVKCEQKFSRRFHRPKITYDLRGTIAGKALYKENKIVLNFTLLKQNTEEFINQTVPHEAAHLVARQMYGGRIKPHGIEWKRVMYALGLEPKRCHSYDVSTVRRRNVSKFEYQCGCQTHLISSTVRNRILMGRRYFCKSCKRPIALKTTTGPTIKMATPNPIQFSIT